MHADLFLWKINWMCLVTAYDISREAGYKNEKFEFVKPTSNDSNLFVFSSLVLETLQYVLYIKLLIKDEWTAIKSCVLFYSACSPWFYWCIQTSKVSNNIKAKLFAIKVKTCQISQWFRSAYYSKCRDQSALHLNIFCGTMLLAAHVQCILKWKRYQHTVISRRKVLLLNIQWL